MNIEFYNFLLPTSISFLLFFIVGISIKLFSYKKRITYIKNFPEYMTILRYYMDKAYDIVYKDKILVYSLEGLTIKEEDKTSVSSDFVKLVIKLIGPTLYKEFVEFFGDDETFIFNLIEFYTGRYEDDEIRKNTMDEMTSKEDEDEDINDNKH